MRLLIALGCCVVLILFLRIPNYSVPVTTNLVIQSDSTSPPIIGFTPRTLTLTKDTSQFLVAEIGVLNRGGAPLHIYKVTPSCGCAAATILKNPVNPLELGKIRLQINTVNMKDTLMRVEYVFESNAETSPTVYSVWVKTPAAR